MIVAVVTAVVALAVATLSLVGVVITVRASRQATATAAAIQQQQVEVEKRKANTAQDDSQFGILQGSIDELTRRLKRVEDDLEHEQEQRRLSNGYARTLAQVLRDNDMPVPQPPAGLDLA